MAVRPPSAMGCSCSYQSLTKQELMSSVFLRTLFWERGIEG